MVLRLLIYYLIQLLSSINGGKEGFNTFVCHVFCQQCICTKPFVVSVQGPCSGATSRL